MPKKNKKVSKKDESDDEYEVEDVDMDEEVEEIDEEENEEVDDEDESDEEKEDLIDEGENGSGCAIDEAIEGDDEYFDNNGEAQETEIPAENSAEYLSKENRVSSNRMTKYEMVRILGERTKQLNMGAKPMIKNYKGLSYDVIAEKEFLLNMIPYKIKRPLPNGKFEIWTLEELNKDHLISLLE
jgi:DNA-directed RNA polymerase subunit K/omega